MTALAGFWSFGGAHDPARSCRKMLASQQVYAPDPMACTSEGSMAMGRRLFATLPEDRFDRGPIRDSSGSRLLVADVRLDNRDDLGAALDLAMGDATRLSDSALVMKAIKRWDVDAIPRLVGDFAIALWDAASHRLLLARDFMGQRPLHYHRAPGFFAFASMPKGLHALPEIPIECDEDAVAEFLALMPERTSSFFRGVRRVQAGHICTVTAAGLTSSPYWNPPVEPLRFGNDADYADAVREAMDRAVAACLRGAGDRVGSQLSGGLDSSVVTATAARLRLPAGQVSAFTSVPREGYSAPAPSGKIGDEGPLAAETAKLYPNIEHVLIRTAGRSPLQNMDRSYFLYERPMLNLCNGVWLDAIMDAARDRRISVMLTGAMGNMSFSYSGLELLSQWARQGRLLRLGREALRLRRNGVSLKNSASQAFGPYLPVGVWRALNRFYGYSSTTSEYSAIDPAREASLSEEARRRGLDLSYRPRSDPIEVRKWALGRVDHGNFNKGTLAGWGIDIRDPTADKRLIELCLRIPADQFLRKGETRSIARRAFGDRVPQKVLSETRRGLQAVDWHESLDAARGEAAEEADRIARLPAAAGMLDTALLRRLIDDWPQGDWNSNRVQGHYRLALLRGVSGGHFVRKASGSND